MIICGPYKLLQPSSYLKNLFFPLLDYNTEAICQVVRKNGKLCGVPIKRDKSSSTKNFHEHLRNVHGLYNSALVKKAGNSQIDIEKWAKNSKFVPKLNNDSLKTALVYFTPPPDLHSIQSEPQKALSCPHPIMHNHLGVWVVPETHPEDRHPGGTTRENTQDPCLGPMGQTRS
ncbi:uncharacterized protein PGTG_03526 [Puccinia graminis f. sp. tritici CRL 75-36-700-3]|uniref:Uncharacterized protein n=1 Tax=Puccinia graminis f. sp. tritici (strain CRL 75-36-700-3 / race SCCL) TaxID=418459 RepID=E3JZU5_PUCGT|nr:uncharacterized protein PGTG_03526 [Puccinia graminis f. sp. tritici CRL 75-36-700-3]EFP77570.1 hypothetical protein PGTG_03526 [Puccinia graminis f. sp. tritici CRL 75-36-700-3]